MEPNPYESPKELDPAPKVLEGPTPHWRWDNTQLLLGLAGIVAGCVTFFVTEQSSGILWEFKVVFRVVAAILFVVGVVLMWGPISRHEDADDDEPSNP
ncbi:MAG: hypothetical protein IAF94_27340 [Pirellulaceae bacterium]|nr:hypothetical protein [Pirellulaceae bacterium]